MIINKKKLFDILQSPNVEPLETDVEIEDLILAVKDIDNKIEFLERLKKDRTKNITLEIEKLSQKKDRFKEVISQTLDKFNHKALNFPGIGRVTAKTSSGKWIVRDEEDLIKFLEENLDKDALAEVIVEKKSIVKKELNKILDKWLATGTVVDSVEKGEESKTLTLSYDKSNMTSIDLDDQDTSDTDINDYDSLEDKEVDF